MNSYRCTHPEDIALCAEYLNGGEVYTAALKTESTSAFHTENEVRVSQCVLAQ